MEHRGGAVLATSGLVVANENLGGDYFAYLVSALGGFAVFAGVLGTHGARGENGWCVVRRPFIHWATRWGYWNRDTIRYAKTPASAGMK